MGCFDIHEVFNETSTKKLKRRKKQTNKLDNPEEQSTESNDIKDDELEINSDERVVSPGQTSSAFMNFVPTTKLKGMEDWMEEETQFKYVEPTYDFSAKKQADERLRFPSLLKAFVFPRGDVTRFPPPKRSSLGTSSRSTFEKHCFSLV